MEVNLIRQQLACPRSLEDYRDLKWRSAEEVSEVTSKKCILIRASKEALSLLSAGGTCCEPKIPSPRSRRGEQIEMMNATGPSAC